jgi:hypothetical protein
MVGVVGSSPIAPTKFTRENKHLAETLGAFFCWYEKSTKKAGGGERDQGVRRGTGKRFGFIWSPLLTLLSNSGAEDCYSSHSKSR